MFGDPHITTLSGVRYTFNGLGEYWLVYTSNNARNASLKIQCHTEIAADSLTGNLTKATVFTGFAFTGWSTVPIIQVCYQKCYMHGIFLYAGYFTVLFVVM